MLHSLPPVALLDARDAVVGEPGLEAQRHHEERIVRRGQPLHGGEVQMVVVVVRDHDHVHPRQLLEGQSRRHQPKRPRPGQRTGPLAPAGVGEDGQPVHAQYHRGVADPGHGGIRPGAKRAPRRQALDRLPRGFEAGWGEHAIPEPTHDELEAHPAAGARIGRVDVTEPALDVVGGRTRQGLGAHAGAAQREQAHSGDDESVKGRPKAGAHDPEVYRRLTATATRMPR